MGCICSKKHPIKSKDVGVETSMNPLTITTLSTKISHFDFGISLIKQPSVESLTLKGWLNKRGHVVRNWKRRYFVLTSNSLKYFKKEKDEPPFGDNLCGEILLKGAIMNVLVTKRRGKRRTNIEIIGRRGEKDLTFELSHSHECNWITQIEWTIRRCSLPYVIKLRTDHSLPVAENFCIFETENRKIECRDWLLHEQNKFNIAIRNLLISRVLLIRIYHFDGTIKSVPCKVSLWAATLSATTNNLLTDDIFINTSDKKLPNISTNPMTYGIKYSIINKTTNKEEQSHYINFDEIINISESNIISNDIIYIQPNHRSTCTNNLCNLIQNQLYTIELGSNINLQFEGCCIHDHNNLFHSMRNIILYNHLRIPTDITIYSDTKEIEKYSKISCIQAKVS